MEPFIFTSLTNHPEYFFELLPKEWQDEIVPFWEEISDKAQIYVLKADNTIIGGGIVFYKSPPHFDYFENEATIWFDKGYHYLGFIWIAENYRNNNLGSFWLDQLKILDANQPYFLLTEEAHLQHFYEKNGFKRLKSVENEDHLEWLFIS